MTQGYSVIWSNVSEGQREVLDGKDKGLEGWTWTGAVKRD